MRIRISAKLPKEYQDYQDLKRYIEQRYPGEEVHESDANPPQIFLYLTTSKGRKGRKRKKSLTSAPRV